MARRPDNQIVGLCRFSYPATAGFRLSAAGPEAVVETLYDPARMQMRFALFETVCLPSLAAQTDTAFRLVVLVGDMMPLRWRRRLRKLREDHPFLEICALPPRGPLQATRRAFRAASEAVTPFVTGFRLDDDDAVAADYVERLRDRADRLLGAGLADEETPVAISFQSGLLWDLDAPGRPVYRMAETRPPAQASAMVTPRDFGPNIFRWNHSKLLSRARCWTEPAPEMFVRTLHGGSDSGRGKPRTAEPVQANVAERLLQERFGVMPGRVAARLDRAHGAEGEA